MRLTMWGELIYKPMLRAWLRVFVTIVLLTAGMVLTGFATRLFRQRAGIRATIES